MIRPKLSMSILAVECVNLFLESEPVIPSVILRPKQLKSTEIQSHTAHQDTLIAYHI